MKRVLFVDDELDLQQLVEQVFRRDIRKGELKVEFAHNGEEALELLEEDPEYDAIFSDINMPVMNGLELIKNITADYPSLRCVVVSAYGDMENVRTAMNHGAFDFITKPIDFDDLKITLQKTMDTVQKIREAVQNQHALSGYRKEIDIAKNIQKTFLPDSLDTIEGYNVTADIKFAKETGGDFYDFFKVSDKLYCFSVADVCGKGVGAALFMATVRTLIRAYCDNFHECTADLKNLVAKLQKYVAENHESSGMFITTFIGFLNLEDNTIYYINAGHNPPYIKRKDGSVEKTHFGEPAIGIYGKFDYMLGEIKLEEGESITVYTDGVTEAFNDDLDMYSEERLEKLVTENREPENLVKEIIADLTEFTGDSQQSDDITILSIVKK